MFRFSKRLASLEDDNNNLDEEMADGDDEVEVLGTSEDMKPAASETAKEEAPGSGSSSFLDDLGTFEVGDEPEKGARIQFRMPDGKRKIRKFSPTDPVKMIYAYLAVRHKSDWISTKAYFALIYYSHH